MIPVDLTKWPRKAIFEFYRDFDYPQINICVDIDVTATVRYLEVQHLSKFKTILWVNPVVYMYNDVSESSLSKSDSQSVLSAALFS